MKRPFRRTVRGAVAVVLACAGAVVSAPDASAAPTVPEASAGCSVDSAAQGVAGAPVAAPVSVPRADGRVDQFQAFHDATASQGLPFVWHRAQTVAGGAYGPWQRVSAGTVGPKATFITGIENAAGGLELFWLDHGGFCHSVQDAAGGAWSEPEGFGLQPAPYHGFLTLFKRSNGTLVAIASSNLYDRSMESRTQLSVDGFWGPVSSMGKVPEVDVGLSQPTSVTELPDRRLVVTADEWNRGDRYWQTYETAPNDGYPHGWWSGEWQLSTAP
ncbi:hypothetical protein PZB75_26670 [Streptomyces sp. AM 4-1-1]|uniref:hypothetical protein n=1 Tax=Streptomyces sp. AM 4-1-1 TaxID=3028710 RepID=UPI0023B889AF|nr:hypothetical protein [Streptomyces sp. AM 4-1-1]WEH36620.1 hypothetical protein PZB75_26670 [Streptomyces sp. AM 4-1-1]